MKQTLLAAAAGFTIAGLTFSGIALKDINVQQSFDKYVETSKDYTNKLNTALFNAHKNHGLYEADAKAKIADLEKQLKKAQEDAAAQVAAEKGKQTPKADVEKAQAEVTRLEGEIAKANTLLSKLNDDIKFKQQELEKQMRGNENLTKTVPTKVA